MTNNNTQTIGGEVNIQTARGIAARIWCDPDYEHVVMDIELADKIAKMLMDHANQNGDEGEEE